MKQLLLAIALLSVAFTGMAGGDMEISGKAGLDLRLFTSNALYPNQYDTSNLSLFIEPELFWEWNEGSDTLTFTPFLRVDQHDNERTHGDIRELFWTHVGEDWELHTGIRKVFWGVTEFQHLVDIINQTDGVEDIDVEEKLGQPMINLSLVRDWGYIDLFVLPFFRERTFPGMEGRLRSELVVDTDQTTFESAAEEHHVDVALRWSHTLGDYDIGAYWFHGTNRDPLLQPGLNMQGDLVLLPYYEQIDQLGLDLQATLGDWLWKFELIWRDSNNDTFFAAQGGFEYTLVGIGESAVDLGLLMEYGWDQRGTATTRLLQNDLLMGTRIALNDAASTEILAGIGYDFDYHSSSLLLEASRRLGDDWKISLDGRFFSGDEPADITYTLRRDDHLQITLERYF